MRRVNGIEGLEENRRSFDYAPFGRFVQDETSEKVEMRLRGSHHSYG